MSSFLELLVGNGEMVERVRAFDWASSPLGQPDGWPESLKTIVRTSLESPFPINLWCGSELVLIYNDRYRRILGAKHPGALGRPGTQVWAEIWSGLEPMFESMRGGGPPIYADDARFVMQRAGEPEGEGEEAWFTFALSAVRDDAGNVVAFLNPASETTGRILAERELKAAREAAERAESRLRDVFAQAPAFLAVVRGTDHVFEFVNDAYLHLVGHRDIIGKPILAALPEVRNQGFVDILDGVLATGEPFVGREVPVSLARTRGAPPEERFVDFVYQPMIDADGTCSGIVAHGSDVTEQVRARREVEAARTVAERARSEAEHANRAKAEFLATMSHELRTPLNAIGGYAELIALGIHGPVTPAQTEALGRLQMSQRHLLGLINDLLNYSRLEAGAVSYDLKPVAIAEALAMCEAVTAPQVRRKRLSYRVGDCDPTLVVLADRDKLQQIVLNLISNATKFTDTGGAITVGCATREHDVVLHVSDTGCGIPADRLEHIFEPFVQVNPHLTRTHEGVGLGLAISRDLARGMAGDLTVESTPGGGSTFTLTLPLSER